ncbi:unnamed protein product, partial [Prorocentrum cordatum]
LKGRGLPRRAGCPDSPLAAKPAGARWRTSGTWVPSWGCSPRWPAPQALPGLGPTAPQGTKVSLYTAKVTRAAALALNTAVGPLIDMASYAFAPQSLIAPLGALDIVWNTMTAPCTLGEKLTPRTLLGCALIFSGAAATSIVGGKHDGTYTVEQIQDFILHWRTGTLAYMLCLAAWLLFNICVLIPRSASPKGEPWTSGDPLRGLSLGMTAGSLSGNMFCVKAFVEIVQGSIENRSGEYWAHWLPYLLLVGAVFFAVSNLFFLDRAMREYEALFMGAVFEGSVILAASISGCVVFGELSYMSTGGIVVYWCGLAIILIGIRLVARDAVRKEPGRRPPPPRATPTWRRALFSPSRWRRRPTPPRRAAAARERLRRPWRRRCGDGRGRRPARRGARGAGGARPVALEGRQGDREAEGLGRGVARGERQHRRRGGRRGPPAALLQEPHEEKRLPAVRVSKRHRDSLAMAEPLFGHAAGAAAGTAPADVCADGNGERPHERAAAAAAVSHTARPAP